ncbi:hypothetical protein FKP32DRAFT_1569090, partial [Trametes sanguinea]
MNVLAVEGFAAATGRAVHWYYAKDVYDGKSVTEPALVEYLEKRHSGQTSHRLGKIPLVLGMPVLISQNFDVNGGVVNGSIGTLTAIRFTTDEITQKRYLRSCTVHLSDASPKPLPGLDNGVYPVLEDTV